MKAIAGVLLVLLTAAPVAAQTGSTVVTISVPPTQVLEGASSAAVTPGSALQRGRLVIKSNTAWVLVAGVSGNASGVAWRPEGGSWIQIDGATAVLRGTRGVHTIDYQVRAVSGQQATIVFTLDPR
ncbi:MAG: hypothetical protein ACRDFA_09610 [bacterium]